MDQDELTIVTDCENGSDSVNVTLSGIAEFTLTLTTEAFSIFHEKGEGFLKPWIDFQEVFIDKVRNSQGILNSSGLIRGAAKIRINSYLIALIRNWSQGWGEVSSMLQPQLCDGQVSRGKAELL